MERRLQPASLILLSPTEVGTPPPLPQVVNRGIYDRGYLKHWDIPGALQAITFRLADSVPLELIHKWKRELRDLSDDEAKNGALHRMISRYEDCGHGRGVLRNPDFAEIVQKVLLDGHPERYRLLEWCIMPNHVHVLIKLPDGVSLASVMQRWKGGSAKGINQLAGEVGTLWQREYYDRLVRDLDHFHECRAYIRNNPVKAKLCEKPEDWPYSSAGCGWNSDEAPSNGAPTSVGVPNTSNAPLAD